ncbi:MAG TPA: hypothetical protein DCS42_14565 [Nitrospiraceae bacterium]|nr:hypothetical protein [Nitrospiraceae bacterium]
MLCCLWRLFASFTYAWLLLQADPITILSEHSQKLCALFPQERRAFAFKAGPGPYELNAGRGPKGGKNLKIAGIQNTTIVYPPY